MTNAASDDIADVERVSLLLSRDDSFNGSLNGTVLMADSDSVESDEERSSATYSSEYCYDVAAEVFFAALCSVPLLFTILTWFMTNAYNGIAMQSFAGRFFQDESEKDNALLVMAVTTLVTLAQVFVGAVLSAALLQIILLRKHGSGLTVVALFLQSLERPTFQTDAVLSSLHGLGSSFTNFGFVWGKASLVQIVKLLEPFETLLWSRFLLPSKENKLSQIGVVCGMTVLVGAAVSLIHFHSQDRTRPEAVVFAFLSGLTLTVRNVLTRRLYHVHNHRASSKTKKGIQAFGNEAACNDLDNLSTFEKSLWQFAQMSFLSMVTLLPLVVVLWMLLFIFHPSAASVASLLHTSLVSEPAILLWHALYNICSFVVLGLTSALTHSLLNAGKRVVSILMAILWFNEPLTFSTWAGLIMVGIGGAWYTIESKAESSKVDKNKGRRKPFLALALLLVLFYIRKKDSFQRDEETNSLLNEDNKRIEAVDPNDLWNLMPPLGDFVPPVPMKLFDTTDPAILNRHRCIARIRERQRDLLEPRLLFQSPASSNEAERIEQRPLQPVLYLDPALHGNIGDNLLAEGVVSFFLHYNRTSFEPCHYMQARHKAKDCNESMSDDPQAKLAAWHPGGNWGDFYTSVQDKRIASFSPLLMRNYNILSFPQSLYYRSESQQEDQTLRIKQGISKGLGGIDLDTEAGAAAARQRVTFTWREKYSYDQATELYPFAENLLVPDIAFQLGPYDTSLFEKQVDIVLFLRSDKESVLKDLRDNSTAIQELVDSVSQPILDRQLTYRVVDWADKNKLEGYGNDRYFTEASLKLISMGKVIICDRLHAFILSYLSGVPIVYLDQESKKITKTSGAAFDVWEGCQDGTASKWEKAEDVTHALTLAMKYV